MNLYITAASKKQYGKMHSHIERAHVLHALVNPAHHIVVQIVDPPPVCNANHDRGRIALEMAAKLLRRVQQRVGQALGFGLLDGLVGLAGTAPQARAEDPAGLAPLVAVRHRQQRVVVCEQLSCRLALAPGRRPPRVRGSRTHDNEARPRRVYGRPALQQVTGDLRIADDDGGTASSPHGHQRAVHVRPLLELVPGLAGWQVPLVAHEWHRRRAWWPVLAVSKTSQEKQQKQS